MLKENMKIVIKEFHESGLPDLIERKGLFDFSLLQAPINKVITIIGPRRAGKTYFLYQVMHVAGQRRSKTQRIIGCRVGESQLPGVKHLSADFSNNSGDRARQSSVRPALAVYRISDNGVANGRAVHPGLMGPAGL